MTTGNSPGLTTITFTARGVTAKVSAERIPTVELALGFSRVQGDWSGYKGVNIWGGKNPLSAAATIDGKSWGTICVHGILYMWMVPKSRLVDMHREARLYSSRNHGRTWTSAGWAFTRSDDLSVPTICQFGRNCEGARDEFMYHYFIAPRDSSDYASASSPCLRIV